MKNTMNIRIFAENNGDKPGFNIYLSFSGQTEFLMYHKHDGLLYHYLKDGRAIRDLKQSKVKEHIGTTSMSRKNARRQVERLSRSIRHLNHVLEDYLEYRDSEYVAA